MEDRVFDLDRSPFPDQEMYANVVVSSMRDDLGTEHVLSRFGDSQWDLSPYFEQSNVPESMKTIRWPSNLPIDLLNDTKAAIYAWFTDGRPGYAPANARTVFVTAVNSGPLLQWLASHGVTCYSQIKPLHLSSYVQVCREQKLRPRAIKARVEIIDLAWTFRERLRRAASKNPWGESDLASFCGLSGWETRASGDTGVGKTPIIPRDAQSALFIHCESMLDQANDLLDRRDAGELGSSSDPMRKLRDSCLYLLSITSGMRNDEAIGVEIGAGRKETRDGVDYHWVTSVEHKTGKGRVEYLVPELTLKVIDTLERYARPLQVALQQEINELETTIAAQGYQTDRRTPLKRLAQARKDSRRLFLGVIYGKFNQITALSGIASRVAFLRLASDVGIDWKLSPHQCRRTYARTVVESQMGRQSLVFLKWQFKHSSISMSQLYASNPAQDPTLYEDILSEMLEFKKELLHGWGDTDMPLSGGAGRKVMEMRASAIPNRRLLIENTAAQINIRATGHGWCIAQEAGCGGAGLYESTRCVDCKNSVIDQEHLQVWRGIHEQHLEMLELDDLGPVANERVRRDLTLSAKVIREFGVSLDHAHVAPP